jgi:hypothetical protein
VWFGIADPADGCGRTPLDLSISFWTVDLPS